MKEDFKRYLVIVLTMILIFAYSIQSSAESRSEVPAPPVSQAAVFQPTPGGYAD